MSESPDIPETTLVLASTSRYRKALLTRLGLPFAAVAPHADETPRPGETPHALVERLAAAKADALAERFPRALIIGSDQVAVLDGRTLGKPGTHAAAVRQLLDASGRRVTFLTGVCLLDAARGTRQVVTEPFHVTFRALTADMVQRYLLREQPYDCAGSFKSEGLGIALFERLEGEDPTALMGLPLIRLTRMLEHAGRSVL